jgi:hypothetical protein
MRMTTFKKNNISFRDLKMEDSEITTLEELKQLRNKLKSREERIGRRERDFNNENGNLLGANTTNEHFSTSTQTRSPSLATRASFPESLNSKVPSDIEYEKLVRDYFTNKLHRKCTLPISSYELLKRQVYTVIS